MAREPLRAIRISEALWSAAVARAQSEGLTMSALIREWLTEYATGTKRATEVDQAALGQRITDALRLAGVTGAHVDLSDARLSTGVT